MIKEHQCQGFEGPCENMNATYNKQIGQYGVFAEYLWLCPDCQKSWNGYYKEMYDEFWYDKI